MEVTDKYREKYATKIGNFSKTRFTPAGHDDIYRLCDAVDQLKGIMDVVMPRIASDYWRDHAQNRLNMILLGL